MRGALSAVLAAIAAIVLIGCGGDARPSGAGTPYVEADTSTPAATATAVVTATPTATGVSSEDRAEAIEGVAVQALTVGDPEEVPAGKLVTYNVGKYAGGGAAAVQLLWSYRSPGGDIWHGDLLATLPGNAQPWSLVADLEHGTVAVASCLRGFCGSYGPPTADSEGELFVSNDGGVSWAAPVPLPRYSDLVAAVNGRVLVGSSPDASKNAYTLRWYPDGESVPRVPDAYPRLISGALVWENDDGSLVSLDWTVLRPPVTFGRSPRNLVVASDGSGWQTWLRPIPGVEQFRMYASQTDSSGRLKRIYSWDSDIRFTSFSGDDIILGNAVLPISVTALSFPTVLIDLRRGVIHPLRTLQGDGGVTTFVRSVRTGPFARVAGTGDCLNVRETASADANVLGCYRDGVLLRLGADPATRSESAWLPVETLDGRHGFAAAAYLER